MTSALFSALSGLQAHESWISVIGNNLANANTPGFKSSRALFSDQFSQTLRFPTLPQGTNGGRNPMQLGLGVQLADIGRNFEQGSLATTGRVFDLAVNGRGFFMVGNVFNTFYTRVGTFGLDGSSRLVDQGSGLFVIGTNNQPITIDTTSLFPPQQTGDIEFAGNLPAQISGPLAQVMTTNAPLLEGTQATMSASASGPYGIPLGETWTMQLQIDGGAPITVSVTNTSGTVDAIDVANAINAQSSAGVTASVNGSNQLVLTTQRSGAIASIKVIPGASGLDLASATGLSLSLVKGTEFTATATSDLNALVSNLSDYQVGDSIDVSGVDTDGSPVSSSFVYGAGNDGTTVADFVAFIDGLYPQATASFDATTGAIDLTADTTGATGLSLAITDNSGAGSTQWAQHAFTVETLGTGPDTANAAIEVYDQAGLAHTVDFQYERQDDGTWNLTASVPASDGTVISGLITGLDFNDDGSLATVPTANTISIQFTGQSAPQTLTLGFGTPGQIDGVSQLGGSASVYAQSQDGYGVGTLSNMAVDASGDIEGFYTNGQTQILGSVGLATFTNDSGLREVGGNLWAETVNSGTRTVGTGQQGPAGEVVGGALENSNVQIAEEFVGLIEAQRGFQANARVISTTNDVLAELVNLL